MKERRWGRILNVTSQMLRNPEVVVERQDRVASIDCQAADPDPRIEVPLREVERAKSRQIRFDGACLVEWPSHPDARNRASALELLEHLLQRVGLERGISREPDFTNSRRVSGPRGSRVLAGLGRG